MDDVGDRGDWRITQGVVNRGNLERPELSLRWMVVPWYDYGMKIAVSLPDDLSASADTLATKLGLSRSRLIALALAEFIAKHRSSKVTERLDAVYATEKATIEQPLRRAQRRAVDKQEW